jgi:hypothetical protein
MRFIVLMKMEYVCDDSTDIGEARQNVILESNRMISEINRTYDIPPIVITNVEYKSPVTYQDLNIADREYRNGRE